MSLTAVAEDTPIKFYIGKNGFIIGKTDQKYIQLEVDENKLEFYYRVNDQILTDIIQPVDWNNI